ncbi:MAG: putative protein-tyrosine phosphatase [Acidimicrobiales bacterium]|nr:putative protein-tyrosine phosphatase [Acidimicrobiales bacterium]
MSTPGADGSSWPRGRSRHGGIDEIPIGPLLPDGAAGRLWLCGKHAIGPDPEALLAEVGASAVVCLTEDFELSDRYPGYVRWLDDNSGRRAILFPIPDLHAPSVDRLEPLLDTLLDRLASSESLLIHCAAGIGRSGTVAACLLIRLGLAEPDALALVAASRPMAGPEVGAQAELVRAIAAGQTRAATLARKQLVTMAEMISSQRFRGKS